jgi:hypothetical protein
MAQFERSNLVWRMGGRLNEKIERDHFNFISSRPSHSSKYTRNPGHGTDGPSNNRLDQVPDTPDRGKIEMRWVLHAPASPFGRQALVREVVQWSRR